MGRHTLGDVGVTDQVSQSSRIDEAGPEEGVVENMATALPDSGSRAQQSPGCPRPLRPHTPRALGGLLGGPQGLAWLVGAPSIAEHLEEQSPPGTLRCGIQLARAGVPRGRGQR